MRVRREGVALLLGWGGQRETEASNLTRWDTGKTGPGSAVPTLSTRWCRNSALSLSSEARFVISARLLVD